MMKKNLKEVVTELRDIKKKLQLTDDPEVNEVYLKRLTELAVVMRGRKTADAMQTVLVRYYRNQVDKNVLLKTLEEFIQELKKEARENGEIVDPPTVNGMFSEVKDVCADVFGTLHTEVKAVCKDVGKTIREDAPTCASAINYVKGTPKRAEKALKNNLRKWLMSDDNKEE